MNWFMKWLFIDSFINDIEMEWTLLVRSLKKCKLIYTENEPVNSKGLYIKISI